MGTLDVVCKMYKHQLDELIYNLRALEFEKNTLQELVNSTLAQMKFEIDKYQETEYSKVLALYLEQQDNNIKVYREKIQKVEASIEGLREEIGQKFSEIKKLDSLIEDKKLKIKQELDKLERDSQDEISSQSLLRLLDS
jgi:hypothetical protein